MKSNPFLKLFKKKEDRSRSNSVTVDPSTLQTTEEKFQVWMYEAENGHHLDGMKQMLADKSILNRTDADGKCALHLACSSGHFPIVNMLLENGADINLQDKCGWNALHFASYNRDAEIVSLLLQKSVDAGAKNKDGNTALHYLARKVLTKELICELAGKGADVNSQNNNGEAPLHHSCWGDKSSLLALIESGAKVNLKSNAGETPLHWAARMGRADLVDLLIKAGADANISGKIGKPIDVAAPVEGIRKLLATGSTVFNTPAIPNTTNTANATEAEEEDAPLPDLTVPRKSGIDLSELSDLDFDLQRWLIDKDEISFIAKIGKGASSVVYTATYRNQEVAVKVLKDTAGKKAPLQEFLKEFKVMSSIRSPYVVFLYGVVLDPVICIVMQHYPRRSLYHVLNEDFQMTWDLFFRWAKEATYCINCLHTWKPTIVHRDLKTLNLLVDEYGNIKICDFGLSRFTARSYQSTLGKLKGTFAYCAPELYDGEQYTTLSDIYSFGVILWEVMMRLVTGRYHKPFSEYKFITKDFQIIFQTARKNLRPTIPLHCPKMIGDLIKQCWTQDKNSRPDCKGILDYLRMAQDAYERDKLRWNSFDPALGEVPEVRTDISLPSIASTDSHNATTVPATTPQSPSTLPNSPQMLSRFSLQEIAQKLPATTATATPASTSSPESATTAPTATPASPQLEQRTRATSTSVSQQRIHLPSETKQRSASASFHLQSFAAGIPQPASPATPTSPTSTSPPLTSSSPKRIVVMKTANKQQSQQQQ